MKPKLSHRAPPTPLLDIMAAANEPLFDPQEQVDAGDSPVLMSYRVSVCKKRSHRT